MIIFENWIEKPFSKTNLQQESAINLAELYWQGLVPKFIKYFTSFSTYLTCHLRRHVLALWIVETLSFGNIINIWK